VTGDRSTFLHDFELFVLSFGKGWLRIRVCIGCFLFPSHLSSLELDYFEIIPCYEID
jgi:hypothetical protein